MAKSILTKTETNAVVKITGSGSEIINLSTDLLSTTQELNGTLKVGIGFIQWTTGGNVVISRNGVTIFELYTNTGTFDLSGHGGCIEYAQGDQNITVTITGGGTVLLSLRKASGYVSKIEPHYFGQYDNPNMVGE